MGSTRISISPPQSRPGANSPSLTPKLAVRLFSVAENRLRQFDHRILHATRRHRSLEGAVIAYHDMAAELARRRPEVLTTVANATLWPRASQPAATARTSASVAAKLMRSLQFLLF
jgi:hypothetical protein